MKCACQKPPAACTITLGGSPSHTKKTMHFYPGDFDAFWRRRWQYFTGLSEINRPAAQISIDNSWLHQIAT
jgi:hypothetical protein